MVIQKEENLNRKIEALTDDLTTLENYIRDLFSFSPLPICFVSPIGIILEANPAFEKIFGKEADEIVGEPIENFFDKKEIKVFLAETEKKDFLENREIFFKKNDGENIAVSLFCRTRKNEQKELIGYFVGFFDLAEIKKNEADLENTKRALLNILEDTEDARRKIEEEKDKTAAVIVNFTDGLIVLDENNRVSLINPKAQSMFGVYSKDVVGKSFSELKVIQSFKGLIDVLGTDLKEIYKTELNIKEDLIVDVSAVTIIRENVNKEKTKIGALIILHDITREKIVEKMKTEFVSISAHQLRTPLSAIKWTLEMLLGGDLGKINKEQREFIGKINISNERMIMLINDLLNVARIEEGRYIYQTLPEDIGEVVDSVVRSYQDGAKRKNIEIEVNKPDIKLPKVKIDTEKIKLAVTNLVDNAVKYTLKGGKVKISLDADEKEIKFLIRDSGIGIPQKQKERVFGKFFRAANVLQIDTEGSGLGLFITKNIIEAHGGKIWFESQEGKGTSFYFTLPL